MKLDLGSLAQWAIQGGLTAMGMFALKVLSDLNQKIGEATESIKELNVNVAEVIVKIAYHEKELDRQRTRIERLEQRDE